jgi:tape measure domain-containing protein
MADERIIRIRLDGSGARAEAGKTNKAVQSVGASADKASSSMMQLSSVANAVITSLATAKVIQYADAWINVNNRLRSATATSKEFSLAQDEIIRIAQRAGVDLGGVAEAYSRIAQATAEIGVSQERVIDVTEKLTLALKAGGATATETSSVMVQFAQGLGSGALQGDELRAILEASIPITRALSKEFGVTTGELKKLGSEGKLTADRVVQAIENIDEKSLTFTKDVSSGFTEVNTALTVYVGKLDETLGASENLYGVLRGLSENIDEVVKVIGVFIQIGATAYILNMTKALIANSAAFIANQAQVVRYNSALASMAGVSRVSAAATTALTYSLRALKAALPFGAIFLGLEVMQRMLTATNDQIAANDRYAESTRKLNERLETRAEKERAISLRTAAEVNVRNQDKLLAQQAKIDAERLKLEQANAAKSAKLRGEEYNAADELTLFQITKTQNRIRVMEEEARRLQRIADNSREAFLKIQNSIGGESTKSQVTKGAFVNPNQAAGAALGRDLDSFFDQEKESNPSVSSGSDNVLTEQLTRENQLIQNSLLARQGIYQKYYQDANDLKKSDFERAQAQLLMDIELQKQTEQEAFVQRLQVISDRQLSIAENKSLTDQQKSEADTLLREQAVLAAQEFENTLTQITEEGNARRQQLDQATLNARISAYSGFANSALSLISAFGSQSEKTQKKFAIAESIINITAGVAKALNNPYPANLGFAAQVAAQGAALVSTIKGTSSGSTTTPSISAPSTSAAFSRSSAQASESQSQRRVIDLRGFESGGYLTKQQLTELLQSDDDVILASNSGQTQAQRTGLING